MHKRKGKQSRKRKNLFEQLERKIPEKVIEQIKTAEIEKYL